MSDRNNLTRIRGHQRAGLRRAALAPRIRDATPSGGTLPRGRQNSAAPSRSCKADRNCQWSMRSSVGHEGFSPRSAFVSIALPPSLSRTTSSVVAYGFGDNTIEAGWRKEDG